ncbi:hypothetical protein DZK25_00445 [Wenzhouxiangella sp. 15181]|nr:hypothetical protein DZK25_00445 [Wenzhouxiangella sp. 15181]RFP68290.1 hypothetical protein DZK26_08610 [Wenzhouxiangella sp. 15190]
MFLPVHRPECPLGFVLSMSTTSGVVLLTVFGAVMALVIVAIHRFIGLPFQGAVPRKQQS